MAITARRSLVLLFIAAALGGIAERVAVYRSVIGKLDGDEAVWGLMARRLDAQPSRRELALFGFVLGFSFWQTDEIVVVAVPVLVWLTVRRPRLWRESWVALPGLVLGVLPWLLSNLRHDWWTFTIG